MNITEYYNEIEKIIDKDCKRIMDEILSLYNKRVEVNKNFTALIKERIDPKYLYLLETYYNKIIKLIPEDLYICPNGKWALVTEKEFNEIVFTNKYTLLSTKEKNLTEIINKITEEFINNNNIDFFETINKYVSQINETENLLDNNKYIMNQIYYNLEKKGYTVISISPLIIKAK